MVNFGEVQRAQLAKSTLIISTLVPLVSFKVFQMQKREWNAESNGKLPQPIQSLGKLQPWFLSFQWKTYFRQKFSLGSCPCSEVPALGHNKLMMIMMSMMIALLMGGSHNFLLTEIQVTDTCSLISYT